MPKTFDAEWYRLAEEVFTGLKEWRIQHPKATFNEIEQVLDERLSQVRTRMLQDMALASAAANIQQAADEDKPVCPQCDEVLQARGRHKRELTTHQNRVVELERSYGVCPACGTGFFPPG